MNRKREFYELAKSVDGLVDDLALIAEHFGKFAGAELRTIDGRTASYGQKPVKLPKHDNVMPPQHETQGKRGYRHLVK
ncbi:hypothetical protein [Motilimonas eburnea]|uniref:hypothetical protein n=1 Tax=Motilimonas eburnea TaxID=1737488 RepID=UPI001E3EA7F8|nr:hypothetical protein [Motilimonas eburnea]MCE2571732.1 hypothetical protein [Motilimonas eburnea]